MRPWYFSGRICRDLERSVTSLAWIRLLAHLRRKDNALYAEDVADIQLLELLIFVITEIIPGNVDLDIAVTVLNIGK